MLRPLWCALIVTAVLLSPRSGISQSVQSHLYEDRTATLLAGAGNDFGGFGIQGEIYIARNRVSLFGGLGYTLELEPGDGHGLTPAVGVRGFTRGVRHRGFLEVNFTQVAVETGVAPGEVASRYFGPGVQLGYQYSALGGFTAMISVGLGHPIGADPYLPAAGIIGLGVGYTFRCSY